MKTTSKYILLASCTLLLSCGMLVAQDIPLHFQAMGYLGLGKVKEAKAATDRLLRQATEADFPAIEMVAAAYRNGGFFDESGMLYKRMVEIAEKESGQDHPKTARALVRLGMFYSGEITLHVSDYPEAEKHLRRALEIMEKQQGKNHTDTADVLDQLAVMCRRQGRYEEAEPLFLRAIVIFERKLGKANFRTAMAKKNLALLYVYQSRFDEAETLLKPALAVIEKNYCKDYMGRLGELDALRDAYILDEMSRWGKLLNDQVATVYSHQGRYMESEAFQRQALEFYEKLEGKNSINVAFTLNNLGIMMRLQGRYEDAEAFYLRALPVIEKERGKDHFFTSITLHELAAAYLFQKKYDEAERLFKRVADIVEKHRGKDYFNVTKPLTGLAAVYGDQLRYDEAERVYRRILDIVEKTYGKDMPASALPLGSLASVHFEGGRHAEAEPLLDRALAIFDKSPQSPDTGVFLYTTRAKVRLASKRLKEAAADLEAAMNLALETRKQASGSDEQRAETFGKQYAPFRMMVDCRHGLGHANGAYEAMERSRAQGLQDLIDMNDIDLLAGVPVETVRKLRDAEAAALREITSCESKLAALLERADLGAAQKKTEETKWTEALSVARKKLVEATAAIRTASPAFRRILSEDRKPVPLETVRQELVAEKGIALEYILGGDTTGRYVERSFCLVFGIDTEALLLPLELNDKQAEVLGVGPGPLTSEKMEMILQNDANDGVLQLIGNPKKATENGVPDKMALDRLAVLWTVLVPDETIRTKITDDAERLLILPDGALARLPFEALVVESDAVNVRYLLDAKPTTVYAPSASMYYNLKRQAISTDAAGTLTVGNPDYSARSAPSTDTFSKMRNTRRAARMGTLKPLPWTEKETDWITQSCEKNGVAVTRLDSDRSTEENVRKNVSGKKTVHLACHGLAESDAGHALFSTLALTVGDPNDPKNDGFLELAEMFALDLKSCELAVLSACDTNLGPNQHGEGTWSMGRGMLASGAKRVVTTDWQVADDASAHLAFHFIDGVNESKTSDYSTALREAKRSIRRDEKHPGWRHPYYWAPFILMGTN